MKFEVKRTKENFIYLLRSAGYTFQREDKNRNQFSFYRFLGPSAYPRFHLFVTPENGDLSIALHFDQKMPVYAGVTAHSGEYDGSLIDREADRIKNFFVA
jgi:hypothetical protein